VNPPLPIPNTLHLLFFRDRGGASIVVGNDGYKWFFANQPKNVKDQVVTSESLPQTLADFKTDGSVEIPVLPSSDWLPSADGSYTATIAFQLDLVDNSLSPQQIEGFDYVLKPPTADEVRHSLENHQSVNWRLDVKDSVPQATKTIFLRALDSIRLSITVRDTPDSQQ
jgi:hypothetical protein